MTIEPKDAAAPLAEPSGAPALNTPMLIAMPTTQPRPLPQAPLDDEAFDAWLRRALIKANDDVLQDPIPDRLLRILQPQSHS